MNHKLPKRNEISPDYKWAIEDLYQNDEDLKKEMEEVNAAAKALASYEGTLTTSPSILLSYLKEKDEASKKLERVYVYANQRYHEDTGNSTYQALSNEAMGVSVNFSSNLAFEEPELLTLTPCQLESFYEQEPDLPFTALI